MLKKTLTEEDFRLKNIHLIDICTLLLEPKVLRNGPEYEEQARRAAEREGRRTRRRFERERNNLLSSHLDGMSSDEETSDRYQEQYQNSLGKFIITNTGTVIKWLVFFHKDQLNKEAQNIFSDVNDEFSQFELILKRFAMWRQTDFDSYKDAYVLLCLPKVIGIIFL